MEDVMTEMSVRSASGGIELFSISSLHTKPGTLGPLRKPKTLLLSCLELYKKISSFSICISLRPRHCDIIHSSRSFPRVGK